MKCAIITPVGPGHEPWYEICRRSIEAAWNYDHGPFDGLDVIPMWDLEGAHGRSARRNDGIAQARREDCEWIFFLDADTQLHAEAFARFAAHVDTHDAVWGTICEATLDPPKVRMRPGQLRRTAFETWCAENRYAVIGHAAARNAVNFLIAPMEKPGG